MNQQHEHYRELIWMLAKTDFKLRYQGSVLGYVWALLKPLMLFSVLNFVFSSIFAMRGEGMEYYSLQLLIGILMFTFFAEGTGAGMQSLLNKSQLVTKIYIPRWTLIVASTVNAAIIYVLNLLVVVAFFAWKQFLPSLEGVALFVLFSLIIYVIILSFALFTAPLFVKFRDLALIWEVVIQTLFYATPIFYALQMMPLWIQQVLLVNPMAFIVHFTKEGVINNHFPDVWQLTVFLSVIIIVFMLSIISYRRFAPNVAEEI